MNAGSSISVVVAVWGDTVGLEDCLRALDRQRDEETRVIVVSAVALPAELSNRYPWVTQLEASHHLLIPHLWAIGMAQATTPIVAITTAHFTPAPDYVAMIRAAHARLDAVGVGGRILPPQAGSVVQWAIYFLRYSAYLSWEREADVTDMAGDNASYKQAALADHPRCLHDGFWEQSFHSAVVAEGKTLRFVPQIQVTQRAAFRFRSFMVQRFRHGLQFGQTRMRGAGLVARSFRTIALPLVPAVLFAKITGRVVRAGRDFGPFVRCLPMLCAFVLAWSAGEAVGTFGGAATPLERRAADRKRAST